MGNLVLTPQEAVGVYTSLINEIYRERIEPKGFFTNLVSERKTTTSLSVSLMVRRGLEKVAADVLRGGSGNRNQSSLETQKTYIPPYFNEEIGFNQFEHYKRALGSASVITKDSVRDLAAEAADEISMMTDKIRRAIEIQGVQVFDTGIVTMSNGDNIDFKRTALSKPDIGSGDANLYWGGTSADPLGDLDTGARYMRQKGKTGNRNINWVFGYEAWDKFIEDAEVKELLNYRRADLIEIEKEMGEQNGAVLKAIVKRGVYNHNIWVHEDFYDNDSNVSTPYWDPKKICAFSPDTKTTLNFGGLPTTYELQNFKSDIQYGMYNTAAEFLIDDYVPETKDAHIMRVRSAPLYTLVSIDRVYSAKVIAG